MSKSEAYEEAKPFLDESQVGVHHRYDVTTPRRSFNTVPWIISAMSWLLTTYLLLSKGYTDLQITKSTSDATVFGGKTYFPTDLEAMRSAIQYEPRIYTGALIYNNATNRIEPTASDDPVYAGPPSKAIDTAWKELLFNEWTPLTDEETKPYLANLNPVNTDYVFEPGMFHALHCLNELRKRIDWDYYSKPENGFFNITTVWHQEDFDRIHIDHCVDHLRQAVMCHGDLTPVPLYTWEGVSIGLGRAEAHTCRKFQPIREWIDQRNADMNHTQHDDH